MELYGFLLVLIHTATINKLRMSVVLLDKGLMANQVKEGSIPSTLFCIRDKQIKIYPIYGGVE